MDYILLITANRLSRKILLKTPVDGKYLQSTNDGKIVLIDVEGKGFEVENVN